MLVILLFALNGDVETIFTDWIQKTYPDRAEKVLNKIKDCHGGTTADSRVKKRMKGEGKIAEIINKQFKLAHKKFFAKTEQYLLSIVIYMKFTKPVN